MPNARILLACDDPYLTERVTEHLAENTDWSVDSTNTPYAAWQYLNRYEYDFVICDVFRHEDGLLFFKQLKQFLPNIKLYVINNYIELDEGVKNIDPDRYLEKPFSLDRLLFLMRQDLNL